MLQRGRVQMSSRFHFALCAVCQSQGMRYIILAKLYVGCTSTFGLPDSWISRLQDAKWSRTWQQRVS